MPRPLRIEYEGALYHVTSRGDHREAIFNDDADRLTFLRTLGETCLKVRWHVHAYCLMTNHFHLVIETPQPNLSIGMKWLLGTYTQRFNRRHRYWGHLFGGRYKAQLIDGRSEGYLRAACDYVHLNPVRGALLNSKQKLESFRWSSYPAYRRARLRPAWLRIDRLLGEHGMKEANARGLREFERRMEAARFDGQLEESRSLQRAWRIGAEDFQDWLADKLARRGRKGERAAERRETDTSRAERIVLTELAKVRWREVDLAAHAKGDKVKRRIAHRLRRETPMTYRWIGDRLKMGSESYVFALINQ